MRGQLSTLEPILIVIMLALIGGFALLFFVRIQPSAPLDEAGAIAILEKVATLPELSCARSETSLTPCIDAQKAWEFHRLSQEDALAYQPLLGFATIRLEWMDLASGKRHDIVLYNVTSGRDIRTSRTYFTVHDPLRDVREFGQITIEREVG